MSRRRRAFTLIEASLAIIIVGTGVVAAAHLLAVGTRTNVNSHRVTTALNLAVSIREMTLGQDPEETLALHDQVLSPPLDARGMEIAGVEGWSQHVSVERADPNNITFSAGSGSDSRLLSLTVEVRFEGQPITTERWLIANTSP